MLRKIHSVDLNYKLQNIFPISIHQFRINDFDDMKGKLINYAYDSKKKDSLGATVSNRGGWQSSSIDFTKDDNLLLTNFLFDCLSELPFLNGDNINYRLDAWININKKGDYNVKHVHPTSIFSGVLWLKCPEKCGEIFFTSPYEFIGWKEHELYSDQFKKENGAFLGYSFKPIEGYMILFPSHLLHHVNVNESDEDRISVAFNMRFD